MAANAIPLIHSLGQPFLVDFQRHTLSVGFVGLGADSQFKLNWSSPFCIRVSSEDRTRKSSYNLSDQAAHVYLQIKFGKVLMVVCC